MPKGVNPFAKKQNSPAVDEELSETPEEAKGELTSGEEPDGTPEDLCPLAEKCKDPECPLLHPGDEGYEAALAAAEMADNEGTSTDPLQDLGGEELPPEKPKGKGMFGLFGSPRGRL
jgi:hypothetical protein